MTEIYSGDESGNKKIFMRYLFLLIQMYLPHSKVEFSGKLVLAVPSEGFLGQRVVERILESDKSFQHVGHGFICTTL